MERRFNSIEAQRNDRTALMAETVKIAQTANCYKASFTTGNMTYLPVKARLHYSDKTVLYGCNKELL